MYQRGSQSCRPHNLRIAHKHLRTGPACRGRSNRRACSACARCGRSPSHRQFAGRHRRRVSGGMRPCSCASRAARSAAVNRMRIRFIAGERPRVVVIGVRHGGNVTRKPRGGEQPASPFQSLPSRRAAPRPAQTATERSTAADRRADRPRNGGAQDGAWWRVTGRPQLGGACSRPRQVRRVARLRVGCRGEPVQSRDHFGYLKPPAQHRQ